MPACQRQLLAPLDQVQVWLLLFTGYLLDVYKFNASVLLLLLVWKQWLQQFCLGNGGAYIS
jgi:hypothetical protein